MRFRSSLRSKPSRAKRTKVGPCKGVFTIGPREKWGETKKVEGRGKGRGKFPSFPSPTPFLPPFCSRPIFRASRMRKTNTRGDTRGPQFVRYVRERLVRRLFSEWKHRFQNSFGVVWWRSVVFENNNINIVNDQNVREILNPKTIDICVILNRYWWFF